MALGTAMGGWKIVKTMGHKIFKLEPVHGFANETSAALVISGASLLGAPISTTHTITACIFGVGSTKRLTAVRWGVAGHLIIAWVLTIPASGLLAACSFFLLNAVGSPSMQYYFNGNILSDKIISNRIDMFYFQV